MHDPVMQSRINGPHRSSRLEFILALQDFPNGQCTFWIFKNQCVVLGTENDGSFLCNHIGLEFVPCACMNLTYKNQC
ncbi:MAG: hypothetical protein EBY32_02685 [Proteobacteria bacterium]|nr:hypothetical protein [Pseudomonadota bacterium]